MLEFDNRYNLSSEDTISTDEAQAIIREVVKQHTLMCLKLILLGDQNSHLLKQAEEELQKFPHHPEIVPPEHAFTLLLQEIYEQLDVDRECGDAPQILLDVIEEWDILEHLTLDPSFGVSNPEGYLKWFQLYSYAKIIDLITSEIAAPLSFSPPTPADFGLNAEAVRRVEDQLGLTERPPIDQLLRDEGINIQQYASYCLAVAGSGVHTIRSTVERKQRLMKALPILMERVERMSENIQNTPEERERTAKELESSTREDTLYSFYGVRIVGALRGHVGLASDTLLRSAPELPLELLLAHITPSDIQRFVFNEDVLREILELRHALPGRLSLCRLAEIVVAEATTTDSARWKGGSVETDEPEELATSGAPSNASVATDRLDIGPIDDALHRLNSISMLSKLVEAEALKILLEHLTTLVAPDENYLFQREFCPASDIVLPTPPMEVRSLAKEYKAAALFLETLLDRAEASRDHRNPSFLFHTPDLTDLFVQAGFPATSPEGVAKGLACAWRVRQRSLEERATLPPLEIVVNDLLISSTDFTSIVLSDRMSRETDERGVRVERLYTEVAHFLQRSYGELVTAAWSSPRSRRYGEYAQQTIEQCGTEILRKLVSAPSLARLDSSWMGRVVSRLQSFLNPSAGEGDGSYVRDLLREGVSTFGTNISHPESREVERYYLLKGLHGFLVVKYNKGLGNLFTDNDILLLEEPSPRIIFNPKKYAPLYHHLVALLEAQLQKEIKEQEAILTTMGINTEALKKGGVLGMSTPYFEYTILDIT